MARKNVVDFTQKHQILAPQKKNKASMKLLTRIKGVNKIQGLKLLSKKFTHRIKKFHLCIQHCTYHHTNTILQYIIQRGHEKIGEVLAET